MASDTTTQIDDTSSPVGVNGSSEQHTTVENDMAQESLAATPPSSGARAPPPSRASPSSSRRLASRSRPSAQSTPPAQDPVVVASDPVQHELDDDVGEGMDDQASVITSELSKKKRKKKPASKRGLGKPTGFEEYHTEGPLTAEEWRQDQDRYNPELPFIDRILTAIQHFEQTKKLTPERRDIFYKYLRYGGVDIGPNMFQGGLDQENLDKTAITAAKARTSIAADKTDLDTVTSLWTVDLLGCMCGFLGRRALDIAPSDIEPQIANITTTLERFMDYLLHHSVCPEYQDSILATRQLCRAATSELWDVAELRRQLPGQCNIACSTLFGGYYARHYDGVTSWEPPESTYPAFIGFTNDLAFQILKYAVAGAATEEVYELFVAKTRDANELEVTHVKENVWFEVTSITPPSKESIEIFATTKDLRAVGVVTAKPWTDPAAQPEDLTPEERDILSNGGEVDSADSDDEASGHGYTFFIEEVIQKQMRVGTKIQATVSRVNCGLWFFDSVVGVLPSFDEWLVNELVEGYKEPRPKKGAWNYVEEEVTQDDDVVGGTDERGEEGAQVNELDGDSGIAPPSVV